MTSIASISAKDAAEVEWHGTRGDIQPPVALDQLTQRPNIRMLRWKT